MAVPGHPTQPACEGTNQLIRDGAALVRDAADVAAELGLRACHGGRRRPPAIPCLASCAATRRPSLEELQARSGLETPELWPV